MWCPDGYVTFRSVLHNLSSGLYQIGIERASDASAWQDKTDVLFELPDDVVTSEEIFGLKNWLIAAFIETFHDRILVCLPSGLAVKPDRELLFWEESDILAELESQYHGADFNAEARAIEGGFEYAFPQGYLERLALARRIFPYIEFHYGTLKTDVPYQGLFPARHLHGFPLCISEEFLPDPFHALPVWLVDKRAKLGHQVEEEDYEQLASLDLTDKIIDAFDRNPRIKKPELKRQLAPGLKGAAFDSYYQSAARRRPNLNKRGPKTKN